MDITSCIADTTQILTEHGERLFVERLSKSWSGGKSTDTWTSNGMITGDFQFLKGKTLKSEAVILTTFDADIVEGDRVKIPHKNYFYVNRVKVWGDHKTVYIYEGD